MLISYEGEDDSFFDSVDCLPIVESIVVKEDESVSDNLGYNIWLNEPQSVKERRGNFLRGMGLVEYANKEEVMGLDRITGYSEAVSSSSVSSISNVEETFVSCRREFKWDANSMVNELEDTENTEFSRAELECEAMEAQAHEEECQNTNVDKKQIRSWWKWFIEKKEKRKPSPESANFKRMEVRQNKKRCMEFSALYTVQEIQAHKGMIWTMKFSPDGKYIATGGEDGVVRIWRVTSTDSSVKCFTPEGDSGNKVKKEKFCSRHKKSTQGLACIPDMVFQIEELPLHELCGHASDVLDLAWSSSNNLLSSSKDRTVRLWQVGSNQCLNVFHHNNYVTCIQFNPVDENYFISGSIDGKVRIWGISEKRVVDWADVRDVITAICYQPQGKGFAVGSITGICRFYKESGIGKHLELESQICIQGRKKNSSNKITGIQFSLEKSQRVMITSEDSKLRIFDGADIVHKYKGRPKSGSQMSASLTKDGKHIISVGEDSRVYIWKYGDSNIPSSKQTKSVCACEHFSSDGVSVAIPWSGMGTEQSLEHDSLRTRQDIVGVSPWNGDSECFSFSNWFASDGPCRRSATWPEEKLPFIPVGDGAEHQQQQRAAALSEMWGIVIVTAGLDGTIKTFHNYGLPIRLSK